MGLDDGAVLVVGEAVPVRGGGRGDGLAVDGAPYGVSGEGSGVRQKLTALLHTPAGVSLIDTPWNQTEWKKEHQLHEHTLIWSYR